jgi:transposase
MLGDGCMLRSLYGIILIVSSDATCLVSLLPDEHLLVCISVERFAGGYRVEVAGAAASCACPKCGVVSKRVHARYQRHVRDLPAQGERVLIRLQARKFHCDNGSCARRVFCERFGDVIRPFARMTGRLEAALQTMALLTSAKVAERIGRALGYPGSASTLLRCAHRYEPPGARAAEVGVDDFAFKRGHTYGTIIIDLATHRPIELLRERSVESLTAYLEAHPEVRVVARDRDARYAEAISLAAPDATVVVDRWHLLQNLSDAFERLVAQRSSGWRAALQTHHDAQHATASDDNHDSGGPGGPPPAADRNSRGSRQQPATAARTARRQHLLERAHDLRGKGPSRFLCVT